MLLSSNFVETTPSPMQLQQIPFYYPINTQGIIQASGVGPPQNIMISSTNSSGGPGTPAPTPLYYQGVYSGGTFAEHPVFLANIYFVFDFSEQRMYSMYPQTAPVNPNNVNANWQIARSPPHQQQQQPNEQQQQRGYGGGQNVVSQAPPPSGAPNPGGGGSIGRSASATGPPGSAGSNAGGPAMSSQYALSGNVPAQYAYGGPPTWYPAQQQVSSPQTNMPSQVNPFGMIFDPSQAGLAQQQAFVHPSAYDPAYFQQAQQPPPQQGLDTVPPGTYNR